jgi:molybdenum cofactor biosynthesis protein B
MAIEEHRLTAPSRLGFAIVTASDSRNEATDLGGARLASLVTEAGHLTVRRAIVREDAPALAAEVAAALAERAVDVVLVTGGTGVAPRDVTLEAVAPLFDKELPGFGELFRALSFAAIGPAAMLSRAAAGVARGKAIFLLPGAPAALELAMSKLILPEAAHLVGQARRSE